MAWSFSRLVRFHLFIPYPSYAVGYDCHGDVYCCRYHDSV